MAVVSDDSDFISLYAKLAEEVNGFEATYSDGNIPFLWVFTDRMGTRSALLQEFFPHEYIHIVDHRLFGRVEMEREQEEAAAEVIEDEPYAVESHEAEEPSVPVAEDSKRAPEPEPEPIEDLPLLSEAQREASETERIALQLIRDMPVGKFKSMDCQYIIRTNFPGTSLVKRRRPCIRHYFQEGSVALYGEPWCQRAGKSEPAPI